MTIIYEENGFNYYEINSRDCSIGSTDTTTSGTAVNSDFSKEDIIIPSRAGKYRVREVGYKAFYGKTSIKRITIQEGIKIINTYAFYGLPNMTLIIIPSSVETIGQWGFSGFYNKTSAGTTTVIIGPNSKLKEIKTAGFERKETIIVYFCGKEAPSFDYPFYEVSKKVVYSPNQITFGEVASISDNGFCSTLRIRQTACIVSKSNRVNIYIIVLLLISQ